MRRLNKIYKPEALELLASHNDYLKELSLRIMRTRDQQLLKGLHRWFEVDLRGAGLTPDPMTYFLMIQASLKEQTAKKSERAVRRYLQLANEAGLTDEVMKVMLGLMNEQDFGRVTSVSLTVRIRESPRRLTSVQIAPIHDFEPEENFADDISENESSDALVPEATDFVPEVRGMDQKGSGLVALKKSLSIFTDPSQLHPPGGLEGLEEEQEKAFAYERQQRLENDAYESAIERWRAENDQLRKMGINNALKQGSIGSMMWDWHEALVPRIEEEVRKCNEAEDMKIRGQDDKLRCLYGPFLQFLSPEKLSAVTIIACMHMLSAGASERGGKNDRGYRVSVMVANLGKAIEDESMAESMRKNSDRNHQHGSHLPENFQRLSNVAKKRQLRGSFPKAVLPSEPSVPSTQDAEWSLPVKSRIGAVLLSHLLEIAKVEATCKDPETGLEIKEPQPACFHSYQFMAGKRIGVICFNQVMLGKLGKEPVQSALAKHLPMVVEPKPWTGYKEGGFLQGSQSVIRFKSFDDQSRRYAITASHNGDLAQVFAGLDVLARTPWKINRPVFDVMLEAWNSGDAIAKIPPENPNIEFPEEPGPSADLKARQRWFVEMKRIQNHKSGLRSQRCFQNFQLEVARAYVKEKFYFPHNVDFRGRAYPMSPFFNHMGADNCRGLLAFGIGRELGATGLRWLKIHLASLFGYDKASFEDRQKFTENHLAEIYDSANNGLKGNRWWLKAEDPWQCLAACIELRNALNSPDPHQFISHLPIHQDGTCNGLQHYAALGGDVAGAKQVNLEPGDRPSDIYTAVAEMIKVEIAEEAAQGSEIARLLNGRLTRKMVKQPVMTNVYGVTYAGAKNQVRRQLDAALTDFPNTDTVNLDIASRYITSKIFKSLSTMFSGAHDIQFWLANCANRISDSLTPEQIDWMEERAKGIVEPSPYNSKGIGKKSKKRQETLFRSPVIWTTPLKMPVVQPYRDTPSTTVETNLQRICIYAVSEGDPVNKRKQCQGFPPNFIHSLDATHMILSALKCNEVGLTFAAVHDSFWTHAADVDTMSGILRDAFIRMHSEDIIGRLAAEFAARYKGSMYLASVKRYSAMGKKIFAFRSASRSAAQSEHKVTLDELKHAEVVQERRRLKLLASKDPKEREEGEAMITAGKIYAENASEEDLAVPEDLDDMAIGNIPNPRSVKLQANTQLEVGDADNVESLEPLNLEATAVDEGDSVGEVEGAEDLVDAEKAKQKKALRKKKLSRTIWVWLPLTFPPVPKKVCSLTADSYLHKTWMLTTATGRIQRLEA